LQEILTIMKLALPNEPASIRNVFLTAYIDSLGKLPCGFEAFEAASARFLALTGLTPDFWEIVLSAFLHSTFTTPDDETKFRNYIGDQAKEFLAKTSPTAPPPPTPVTEIALTIPLIQVDIGYIQSLIISKNKLATFEDKQVAEQWQVDINQGPATKMAVQILNSDSGPKLVVRAFNDANELMGESPPAIDVKKVLPVRVADTLYLVSLEALPPK
jgi:hypothetical protein